MVTGATTADAVVVLVDGRKGVLEQTRRHLAVVALLRVPHVIVAVNKIDLLGYSRGRVRARSPTQVDAVDRRARHRRRARHPRLGARGRQHRRPLGAHALVRRPGPARTARGAARRTTSSRPRLEALPPAGAARAPSAGRRSRRASPTTDAERCRDYRAFAGRIVVGHGARRRPGRRCSPAGIDDDRHGHRRRPAWHVDAASAPQSVVAPARRRRSTPRAAPSIVAAGTLPEPAVARSMPSCSGSTPGRCVTGARVLVKHGTSTVQAIVARDRGRAATSTRSRTSPPTASRSTTSAARACAWPPTCPSSEYSANAPAARSSSSTRPTARHSPPASCRDGDARRRHAGTTSTHLPT